MSEREPRDMTPALGAPGEPASWRRAEPEAEVALQAGEWADAAWSFLYDEGYAPAGGARAERPDVPVGDGPVQGPVLQPPVWTWEVPLYFWTGGIAAGASFVAVGADLAGDPAAARVARRVALAGLAPSPVLLVMDLGRPGRFLNMLRVFKPRSPMSMGAWTLAAFGPLAAGAVAADALGARRAARALGAGAAALGLYLGSYGGVLLATTAVPLWARSRTLLGPIFAATATGSGAAACRLALAASGEGTAESRRAVARVEVAAFAAELALAEANRRRLGEGLGRPLREGRSGRLFRVAEAGAGAGLALTAFRRPAAAGHAASALLLAAALAFRYGWVEAGRASARDHEVAARVARGGAAPA